MKISLTKDRKNQTILEFGKEYTTEKLKSMGLERTLQEHAGMTQYERGQEKHYFTQKDGNVLKFTYNANYIPSASEEE